MNSPSIRLVCAECLRSVEMTLDGPTRPPDACPYCGGPFEGIAEEIDLTGRGPSGSPLVFELSPDELVSQVEPAEQAGMACVGRFQLREPLGGGGYGRVHRAYDPRLDRDIALKVLKEVRPGARAMERFFREARAAARLDHPHIVPLHDAGRDNGRCWIAYQYIEGRSLAKVADHHPVDLDTAVKITRDVAEALDYAHRRGVFHRDLKPSNILIEPSGRARLTDFGLAKRLGDGSTLTGEGVILGTLAYMSPEQAEGRSHQADARSDLFSLGVVFYELICGRRPNEMPSGIPAWRAAQAEPAPPPRSVNPSVPRPLDRICRRILARDPVDRYPNARLLIRDLDRWLGRSRRYSQASRLVLGTLAGGLLGFAIQGSFHPPKPDLASISQPDSSSAQVAALPAKPPDSIPSEPPVEVDSRSDLPVPRSEQQTLTVTPAAPKEYWTSTALTDRHFHKSSCKSGDWLGSGARTFYANPSEAEDAGYKPCPACLPEMTNLSTKDQKPEPAPPAPSPYTNVGGPPPP